MRRILNLLHADRMIKTTQFDFHGVRMEVKGWETDIAMENVVFSEWFEDADQLAEHILHLPLKKMCPVL